MQRLVNALVLIGVCGIIIFAKNIYNKRYTNSNATAVKSVQGTEILNEDVQDYKKLVTADIVIPESYTTQDLKACALIYLDNFKGKYPTFNWFSFRFFDDSRMIKSSYFLALMEQRDGVISLQGGIPTKADIAIFNKEISTDPLIKSLGGYSKIHKPNDNDLNISSAWHKYKRDLKPESPQANWPDEKIDIIIARNLKMHTKDVTVSRNSVFTYYTLNRGQKLL